ncbi:MAG: hypothetical protein FWC94_01955 [Bacteroidales bacterium]|nr:hypothetical protein [Bacteroidales bacterium]
MKKRTTNRPQIEDQKHYKRIGRLRKSIADAIGKIPADIYIDDNHLKHILNRHKTDLAKFGFTPLMFVDAVVSNFNRIYQGDGDALQLVIWNGNAKVTIVEINSALKKEFYEVKTALTKEKRHLESKKLLWKKK